MGIKKSTAYKGISLPNGFHVVTGISIDYVAKSVQIGVGVYADRDAYIAGSESLSAMSFGLRDSPAVMDGATVIIPASTAWTDWFASGKKPHRYAYDFLLTRPEFTSGVEVA